MAVTVEDIAVELGRPTPVDVTTAGQWSKWIDRAVRLIAERAASLGVDVSSLDPDAVDDVVTQAVALRALAPADGAEQVTEQASVDDTQVQKSRRYGRTASGPIFLDEWWARLGLSAATGAWTHDTREPHLRGYTWLTPDRWVPLP